MNLKGKRIIVTRPRHQAGEIMDLLTAHGAEVILFPVIRIEPIEPNPELEKAVRRLSEYNWLILTSVNGVEAFVRVMASSGVTDLPDTLRIAVIGPKTAQALQQHGIQPHLVPKEYVAEAIVKELGEVNGLWFLLPRAEIAREALPRAIREGGGFVHVISTYRTVSEVPEPGMLEELELGIDVITFTSPSTVKHFVSILKSNGLNPFALPGNPWIACIGPITADAAETAGFTVHTIAQSYTSEGLVQALLDAPEIHHQELE